MGDERLGGIPTSQKWAAVVDQILGGAGLLVEDTPSLAASALDAASAALEAAKNDPGLRYTFYLLTQIALATRQPDWRERLRGVGIALSDDASVFDLTAGLQSAVDGYVERHARPTDVSEIAQQAAGEALTSLAAARTDALFGRGAEHLQSAVRQLSTENGFSSLGQRFFGRLLSRFLNFYLSRVTAAQVGSARLGSISEVSRFDDALTTHCEESALIVRTFCGQWYSKTEYVAGINPQNTSRFMAVAMRKLSRQLAKQRAEA